MPNILAPLANGRKLFLTSATGSQCLLFAELADNADMTSERKAHRKATITDMHVQEAAQLREIFMKKAGMSQSKFGQEYGIGNQGMVWQYLNADAPLNAEAAAKFAKGLRCHVSEFSERIAKQIREMAEATNIEYPEPDMTQHEKQLLDFYRQLPAELQHYLLADANKYHNIAHPNFGAANPFPEKSKE